MSKVLNRMYTVGTKLRLFITHIKPESVWLKIWAQEDLSNSEYVEDELQNIESILEGQASLTPHPGDLNVGDICCAKFIEDEKWYRARIIDLSVVLSNKVGVKFIDYGNIEFVAISDIRKLDNPVFTVPPLASEFLLADVVSIGTAWNENALIFLKNNICYHEVSGIIVCIDGPIPKIRISDTKLEVDCLSEYLIKRNFALAVTNKFDYTMPILQIGKDYTGFIIQVNSLNKFWIQIAESETELEEIRNEIEAFVNSNSKQLVDYVQIGLPCIVQFSEDGLYYRSKVVKICNEGFMVHFVDYGNFEMKQASELWTIPPSLLAFASQAIECCLFGAERFLEIPDAISQFTALTENKELTFKVLSKTADGRYMVDIEDNNNKIVNYFIIENLQQSFSEPLEYSEVEVLPGNAYEVVVSHISSLNKFYCQLSKNLKNLTMLMKQLQPSMNSCSKTITQDELENNLQLLPCTVKCSFDNKWYRAKLVEQGYKSAVVAYVDYGIEKTVDLAEIKKLDERYISSLPAQAIQCSLVGFDNGQPDIVEKFFNLTRGKTLIMKVHCVKESVFVDLYDMNVIPHIHINEILQTNENSTRVLISPPELRDVEEMFVTSILPSRRFFAQLCKFSLENLDVFLKRLNVHYGNIPKNTNLLYADNKSHLGEYCCTLFSGDGTFYRAQVISETSNIAEVLFVDYGNSETKNLNEIQILHQEYSIFPQQGVICKIPEKYSIISEEELKNILMDATIEVNIRKCIKNEYVVNFTDSPSNNSIKDKLESLLINSPAEIQLKHSVRPCYSSPVVNDKENIIITHIVSPNNIWCQLQRSATALLSLMDEIHSIAVANDKCLEDPRISMACMAQYTDDGWYRAQITNIHGGSVEVHFVDFGNTEEVNLSNIKPIPDYCLSLPRQCIKCTLPGIPCQDTWDPMIVKELENILLEKHMYASFTAISSDPELYSLLLEDTCQKYLNEGFLRKLISNTPKTPPLPSSVFEDNAWEENASTTENNLNENQLPQPSSRFIPNESNNQWKNTAPRFNQSAPRWNKKRSEQEKPYGSPNSRSFGYSPRSPREKNFHSKPSNDFKPQKLFGDYSKKYQKQEYDRDRPSHDRDRSNHDFNKTDLNRNKPFAKPFRNQTPTESEGNNNTVLSESNKRFSRKYSVTGSEESFDASSDSTENSMNNGRQKNNNRQRDSFGKKSFPNNSNKERGFRSFNDRKEHLNLDGSGEPGENWDPPVSHLQQQPTHQFKKTFENNNISEICKNKTFEIINVDVGHFKDVTIVYVISPSEFYCHLIEEAGKLKTLMNSLASTYDSIDENELQLQSLQPNSPCCAKYIEDNSWYRAKILTNLGSKVEVVFVDYGNTDILPIKNVKELKAEFLSLPAQAIKCQLDNSRPVGDSWMPQNVQEFQKLTLERCFVAQVMSISPTGALLVNLIDVGLNDVSINHKFVKSGHGKFSKAPVNLALSEGLATYINPVIAKGTKEAVQLSWIKNFAEFYCNILKNKTDLDFLMEKMQHFYSTTQCSGLVINNWCIGNPCVAKFSQDGVWYRAVMKEILGESIKVEYVDFGNSEVLPKYKVNAIVPEFMMLPIQAIKCRLNGLRLTNDLWSGLPMQMFEKYLSDKAVCHFVGHSRDLYVVDWIVNDNNVIESIITDGLGVADDRPLEEVLAECKRSISEQLSINRILAQYSVFPMINLDWQESEYKDVVICDGGNPYAFWCYLASDADKIKNLSNLMDTHYSTLMASEMKLTNPKQGTPCAVKLSESGGWLRGVVIDRLSPSKLLVFLIEVGLQEEVNITQTKILASEFLQTPQLIFQCRLSNFPDNLNVEDLTEQFSILNKDRELVLQFVEQKNIWIDVNLYDISDGHERNIIELLLSDKKLRKGIPGAMNFPAINLPWELGQMKSIVVSGICFPEKFWCQLVSATEDIQSITARLSSFYSSVEGNRYQLKNPSPGTLCVVKSHSSDAWNRAIVQKILSPTKLQVFYVDIGRDDDVQLVMAKIITDEFLQIPVQAFPCCLKGYENIADTTDLYRQFDGIVSNTELLAKLESLHDCIYEVSLYIKTSNKPLDVLTELIGSKAAASSYTVTAAEIDWNVGEEKEITITGLGLPDQFWCQLLSSVEKFTQFTNKLSERYDNLLEKELELSIPVVGSPCVAWSSESQKWYRAIIQSQMSDTQVLVSFVDTGNWEKVQQGKVKSILPEFLDHPSESFKCRLAGLPSHAEVTKMGYYFFDVIYEKKYFIAKLDAKIDNFYEIILYYESQEKRYNVNEYVLARYKGESYPSPKATPHPLPNHFKPAEVQLGKYDGFVSHVNSAKDFYVHLTSIEDELHFMSENLNEVFAKISDGEMVPHDLQVGQVCCALYSQDDIWYRSEVTMISGDDISVRFVDYGNVDIVKRSKVKVLPAEYLANPVLAIHCTLSTGDQNANLFDDNLIDFHKHVLDKDLNIEFLSKGDPCEVVLYDAESGLSVIEISKAEKVDVSKLKESKDLNVASETKNDSPIHTIDQYEKTPTEPHKLLNEASDAGAYIYPTFTPGKRIEVTVSHVVSPSQFWLQIINQQCYLDELFEKLNAEDQDTVSEDSWEIKSETSCIALYSEDNTWYRAKVLAVEEDDIHVNFVDYGNSDTVKARNVRRLKPDELQIPVMALECELSNVTCSEDDWTVDAIEEFESLVLEKTLLAEIVSHAAEKYSVILLHMGINVANTLAERGFTELICSPQDQTNSIENETNETLSEDFLDDNGSVAHSTPVAISEHLTLMRKMSDEYVMECLDNQLNDLSIEGKESSSNIINDKANFKIGKYEMALTKEELEYSSCYKHTSPTQDSDELAENIEILSLKKCKTDNLSTSQSNLESEETANAKEDLPLSMEKQISAIDGSCELIDKDEERAEQSEGRNKSKLENPKSPETIENEDLEEVVQEGTLAENKQCSEGSVEEQQKKKGKTDCDTSASAENFNPHKIVSNSSSIEQIASEFTECSKTSADTELFDKSQAISKELNDFSATDVQ